MSYLLIEWLERVISIGTLWCVQICADLTGFDEDCSAEGDAV